MRQMRCLPFSLAALACLVVCARPARAQQEVPSNGDAEAGERISVSGKGKARKVIKDPGVEADRVVDDVKQAHNRLEAKFKKDRARLENDDASKDELQCKQRILSNVRAAKQLANALRRDLQRNFGVRLYKEAMRALVHMHKVDSKVAQNERRYPQCKGAALASGGSTDTSATQELAGGGDESADDGVAVALDPPGSIPVDFVGCKGAGLQTSPTWARGFLRTMGFYVVGGCDLRDSVP